MTAIGRFQPVTGGTVTGWFQLNRPLNSGSPKFTRREPTFSFRKLSSTPVLFAHYLLRGNQTTAKIRATSMSRKKNE